jgi:UDPglucose 6-dehydrogenase
VFNYLITETAEEMKIAIIGLGHVGSAFKELVKNHHELIEYDPIHHDIYPQAAIDSADMAVICTPTPMNTDGSCDTSIVEEAIKRVNTPLILIKSTVAPGTTQRLVKTYNKSICFSPEYIGESTYNNPLYKTMADTPFAIVGGESQDVEKVFNILEPIMGPHCQYFACDALEAEIIKYMENSFLATKVAFVNEFYDISTKFGANWHTVREGWLLDQRIGRPFTSVFKDSRGFGGKCLPKDTSAIIKASELQGYTPTLMKAVVDYNKSIQISL